MLRVSSIGKNHGAEPKGVVEEMQTKCRKKLGRTSDLGHPSRPRIPDSWQEEAVSVSEQPRKRVHHNATPTVHCAVKYARQDTDFPLHARMGRSRSMSTVIEVRERSDPFCWG